MSDRDSARDGQNANRSEGPGSAIDGFDLERLKLSQSFSESLGIKKCIVTIPVRKPNRQEFIRVHPSEDMRMMAAVIEVKEGGSEVFVVTPQIASELPGEISARLLVATIT